jgi:signal transduction histidine kinase
MDGQLIGGHLMRSPGLGSLHLPQEWSVRRIRNANAPQDPEREKILATVSHDLRTPLAAVRTMAQLITLESGDMVRVAHSAAAILRCVDRMTAMLDDLAQATQIGPGRMHLDLTEIDPASFLGELLDRLRGGLAVERVAVHASPGLPPVQADPARLERAVVNLVSNALKYSAAPSPVVITASAVPGGVELAFVDQGVGIPAEALERVFEPFFRVGGSVGAGGLGLGLHIARSIVEAHGGRIGVESRLGHGSTFRVVLPAAVPDLPRAA